MRPLTRLASLVVVTAALAGCGDKSLNFIPVVGLAGTWNLETINGNALPVIISESATDTVAVSASSLVMVSNSALTGTFNLMTTTETTSGGVAHTAVDTVSGSYSLSATTLTLTSSSQTITGTFNGGNTLSLSEDGATFVFARQ